MRRGTLGRSSWTSTYAAAGRTRSIVGRTARASYCLYGADPKPETRLGRHPFVAEVLTSLILVPEPVRLGALAQNLAGPWLRGGRPTEARRRVSTVGAHGPRETAANP